MEKSYEDRLDALEDGVEKLSITSCCAVWSKLEKYVSDSVSYEERFSLNLDRLEKEFSEPMRLMILEHLEEMVAQFADEEAEHGRPDETDHGLPSLCRPYERVPRSQRG